jgi:phosphohistidine phosphatase SixA
MFVLVRHAHAGSKRRWTGPDEERPLSPRGADQARDLARLLSSLGVVRLMSSPALRCRETLQGASEELWVPVEPVAALAADAPAEDLLRLVASAGVHRAALCTHRETLQTLSQAWQESWPAATGSPPPDVSPTPKAGCWVVEHYGTAAATARFAGRPSRMSWS